MRAMRFFRYLVVAACLMSCASAKNEPQETPKPTKELASGGARLRGGGMRMDVQVARGLTTKPLDGGTLTANPNATVTP